MANLRKKHRKVGIGIRETIVAILFFIVIFFVIFLFVFASKMNKSYEENIRQMRYAGTWYPANPVVLNNTLNEYHKNTVQNKFILNLSDDEKLRVLIVPHAGYTFSGQIAEEGYAQLERQLELLKKENKKINKVFIIASNHNADTDVLGIATSNYSYYETLLGKIRVSNIAQRLLQDDLFYVNQKAEESHIIEAQLPFLQYEFSKYGYSSDDYEIIPLITGGLYLEQIKHAADVLSQYIDDETLIVISSDFSHYHAYGEAVTLDNDCINKILTYNTSKLVECEACGIYAIAILKEISLRNGWHAKLIDYKNSGDVTNDKTQGVVGYVSMAFYENENRNLSSYEKELLLNVSHFVLDNLWSEKQSLPFYSLTQNLKDKKGCFVTLNEEVGGEKRLRGCIGYILPNKSLYECVIENTQNAALHDTRFNPVTKEELPNIELEISVLSVPKESTIDAVKTGDGVILSDRLHEATYLPQVWEQLLDKNLFLSMLCEKAGMNSNCYTKNNINVMTYSAEVFD